eukprot:TRINITY_DN4936_c0_g1_i4.p2 TRINITY_DN4936_c0_g1~~TRINITY_DN4936_c0_g1_i4.p2  ORF type:complete len:113 (+),score=9.91 TRINITY_DN4936_c0_g1_i4:259-597(+)
MVQRCVALQRLHNSRSPYLSDVVLIEIRLPQRCVAGQRLRKPHRFFVSQLTPLFTAPSERTNTRHKHTPQTRAKPNGNPFARFHRCLLIMHSTIQCACVVSRAAMPSIPPLK